MCRISGTVVHGWGIGKLVGMPTANLMCSDPLPKPGVYAARVCWDGESCPGAAYVGPRPTVERMEPDAVEVHLLDFAGDLYDRQLTLLLYGPLRQPICFPDFPSLLTQIAQDCAAIRKAFALPDAAGTLTLCPSHRSVFVGGREITLTEKEFDVLQLLLREPNRTLSKQELYERVWHQPTNGCCHAVENTVFQIRKKLRPAGIDCIRTVPGLGYRCRLDA